MESSAPAPVPAFERFLGPAFSGPYARDQVLLVTGGEEGLYRRARVREGATVLSEFVPDSGREPFPAVYLYRNAEGMRVCVSCFDFYAARHGRQLAYSGARQEQWARALAWASGRPLPAVVPGEPDLHLICRAAPDGKRIAVCIQNLRLDPLVNPVVRIDPGIGVNRGARILLPGAAGPVRLAPMEKRIREGFLEIRIRARVPAMGTLCLGLPQKKPFRP
jgi:hypothetical protein